MTLIFGANSFKIVTQARASIVGTTSGVGGAVFNEESKSQFRTDKDLENDICISFAGRCAERINTLSEEARIKSGGDYHTDEHILVCLSSAPSNMKIIRTAARMAKAFRGSFTALYVETSDFEDIAI